MKMMYKYKMHRQQKLMNENYDLIYRAIRTTAKFIGPSDNKLSVFLFYFYSVLFSFIYFFFFSSFFLVKMLRMVNNPTFTLQTNENFAGLLTLKLQKTIWIDTIGLSQTL